MPPPAILAQPPALGEDTGSPAAAAACSAASRCALVRSASSFWMSRMDRWPAWPHWAAQQDFLPALTAALTQASDTLVSHLEAA